MEAAYAEIKLFMDKLFESNRDFGHKTNEPKFSYSFDELMNESKGKK